MKNRATTLLALLAANDRLGQLEIHRTVLVKQAYLAETIRPIYCQWLRSFSFVRYQHGPWSEDIFPHLDVLIFNGLVDVSAVKFMPGRTEARYRITSLGHDILQRVGSNEILKLAFDLVWALQALGIERASTICKLVYEEAEFARIFAQHKQENIGPESKVPLPSITAANNETFVTLATVQAILQSSAKIESTAKPFNLPSREVVRIFLSSLGQQIPAVAINQTS